MSQIPRSTKHKKFKTEKENWRDGTVVIKDEVVGKDLMRRLLFFFFLVFTFKNFKKFLLL